MRAAGIDLAAGAAHVVVVEDGAVVAGGVFDEVAAAVAACAGAERVGVDAPSGPSAAVHAGEPGRSPKFAPARCGEIAAGEQLRVWVPWVTGRPGACLPWMEAGFRLWEALVAAGHDVIEVYPAGSVRLSLGGRVPRKTTPAGLAARRELLAAHVTLPPFAELWSHDSIDATIAAAVAAQGSSAIRAGHDDPGCDGSSIWFLSPDGA